MARTRTSDHTFSQKYAKPLVYACLLTFAVSRPAAAQGPSAGRDTVPCVACQVLSVAPAQVGALPGSFPNVTVALRVPAGQGGADTIALALTELQRRNARVALHVVGVPGEQDPLLALPVDLLAIELDGRSDRQQLAFDLKRALTAARGRQAGATLLVAAAPDLAAALQAQGLTPYVDGFIDRPVPLERVADLFTPGDAERTRLRPVPLVPERAAPFFYAAASTAAWFPKGLLPASDRRLLCDGRRLDAFLNPQTLSLVAASRTCPAPAAVTSDVRGQTAERLDLDGVSVFRLHPEGEDRFAEGVEVGTARTLTAAEIVARHQAAAARQSAGMPNEIAAGTLTLAFEAPGFVAPVTITAATTIFRDAARTDMRQSDVRVNGVLFTAKNGVPRLPIIEPERVAVVPLAIALTDVYHYELDGRETVDGRPCHVVAFTPQTSGASLFRGRAWIDERTFGMVRVSAVQTGLTGPIVASEQTDTFALDASGRWLLARSDISQTYEGASVRTPIHRLLVLDRHEIDTPDFAARRAAAYASTDVILRDTPDGFRYLKREAARRQPDAGSREPEAGSGSDTTRVVAPPVTRIRTFAMGVIVDPNITTPLPFAGLSYVDFDLFHTGTQFSGFFGGSYAQAAFSAPSVGGTRWQLAGRAFAIATSYNDRAFEDGRELYDRDITQRPAQVAVWALRPIAARAAFRFEYDWDYNRFERGSETNAAFAIPRNQNAHGLRAGLDVQYAGWQISAWASHTIRVGWRGWGLPGSSDEADPRSSFQRAGASVLRTAAVSPRVTTRVEGSIVGGSNMDRFSRISFGTFDNRLHGYPSALIRYDRGGVARTALSWTAAHAVRVDGFADAAAVHDPGFGRGLRGYLGLGAAIECPAPFGSLVAVEWGYGVQGINTDGRAGTHVVRITGYKVF